MSEKPTEQGPFVLSIVKIYPCCLLWSPWERHFEIPPYPLPAKKKKKKRAGIVNNNPEIIQMSKHFQNWLYKVLLTSHQQAKWEERGKKNFYLPFKSGHTRQDRDRGNCVINMVIMYFITCVRSQEGPESYLVQAAPVTPEETHSKRLSGWPSITHFHSKANFGTPVSGLSVQCSSYGSMTP